MNYVRCARCKTLYDGGVTQRCFACGVPLAEGPGAPRLGEPPSERQAGTDLGVLRILFAVFGVFGLFGIGSMMLSSASSQGVVWLIAIAGVVVAGVGGVIVTRRSETSFSDAGGVILNSLAVVGVVVTGLVATVVGLVLLLFMVCVTGGLGRIAG